MRKSGGRGQQRQGPSQAIRGNYIRKLVGIKQREIRGSYNRELEKIKKEQLTQKGYDPMLFCLLVDINHHWEDDNLRIYKWSIERKREKLRGGKKFLISAKGKKVPYNAKVAEDLTRLIIRHFEKYNETDFLIKNLEILREVYPESELLNILKKTTLDTSDQILMMFRDAYKDVPGGQLEILEREVARSEDGYRMRLFVGEGDLGLTKAFINKKRAGKENLAKSIVATEIRKEDQLLKDYRSFQRNKKILEKSGAIVKLGIDGTRLHRYGFFKETRYSRIHFCFPHSGDREGEFIRESGFFRTDTSKLLSDFFYSASQLQGERDRIYIVLPKPEYEGRTLEYTREEGFYFKKVAGRTSVVEEEGKAGRQFYHGYIYDICLVSLMHNYRLVKKRPFLSRGESARGYEGYKHRLTYKDRSARNVSESREYIFEKMSWSFDEREEAIRRFIEDGTIYLGQRIKGREVLLNKEPMTSDESSDYSDLGSSSEYEI